jgi:shikimate dehydrogenase
MPLGDGRLRGYSTDGAGFVASLLGDDVDVTGKFVCVLGAGGAARAIVDAVARAGAASITVVNRSARRAEDAASLAPGIGAVGGPGDIAHCDIVINATSIGMGTDDMPCDAAVLRSDHVVADIVYHPRETTLLRTARDVGAKTVEGLGMLVHQAVLQQQLWTGATPDAGVLWAAAERELASRGQ